MKPFSQGLRLQRRADHVSLGCVTAKGPETFERGVILDALGHSSQAEMVGEIDR
jgi:hypothetical protein